jgi:hypothetical protein
MYGTTTVKNQYAGACKPGTQVPFQAINTPGCYICNWSGHLLRVPQDGVAAGQPTALNIVGNEPLFVTMLSENPFIPVTKARVLAADFDLACSF